ncbi:MAG: PEP-CTERM sorting domain-containing protein [Sedimentisphaerales bacterium]|nr:PEP-CTERM sorting domain-containing protein [Sedimentisphaerales bacterium]
MKTKKTMMFVIFLVMALLVENADAVLIDFEDRTAGESFDVGYTFITSGVSVTGEQFQWSNTTWYSGGNASIGTGGSAGGADNEINTNNINLDFDFGVALTSLSLQYGEYGGNINLEINGDFQNVENFADLPANVGATSIFVYDTNTPGQGKGALIVIGTINSFKIGGQELWLDNIIASAIPEPAILTLLALGSLIALRRKTYTNCLTDRKIL